MLICISGFVFSSAPQKYGERSASSGSGPPPLKQLKSYSVDNQDSAFSASNSSSPQLHHSQQLLLLQRARQRSIGSGAACRRLPCRTAEDIIKFTRVPTCYELSQDLLDKQVEVLERKYGGQTKAGHAALTIQRAFRKYCMVKKFQDITSSKSEKRLSRRFNGAETPANAVATSRMAPAQENVELTRAQLQCNFAALCRELNETLEPTENGRPPRPVRSLSLREKRPTPPLSSASSTSDASSQRSSGRLSSSQRLRLTKEVDDDIGTANNSESDFSDAGGGLDDGTTTTYCGASPPALSRYHSTKQNGAQSAQSVCVNHLADSITSPYSPPDLSPSICHDPHCDRLPESTSRRLAGSYGRTAAASLAALEASSRRNSAPPGNEAKKKIPPEVPKRTSSISIRNIDGSKSGLVAGSDLMRSPDGGSLSSVQSSGSESSLTGSGSDRATPAGKVIDESYCKSSDTSNSLIPHEHFHPLPHPHPEDKRLSNISENSEDSFEGTGYSSSPPVSEGTYRLPLLHTPCGTPIPGPPGYSKVSEVVRKRQYRVGLNLFNKKPEKGICYLIQRAFLENSPQVVARFLITRKGLSKQMIGEYLGNLQNPFNMEVLECFAGEIDLAGMQVDVALRKFQTYFRMPGEAQKIERLVEVFSSRYCDCNRDIVSRFRSAETVFILAFAIIMLNTDLHTPNMKPEKRMKPEDFVRNLRGVDDGADIDLDMLLGIYDRIKANEFRPGSDHVTQVMKVQQTIVGKKPLLALSHRRLVCYCRLYEVIDINKKERQGLHQREVFLFNDLLVVTKILSKKKNGVTYTFRQSFPLCGLQVSVFEVAHYPHGIRLAQKVDGKIAIVFNARNEHDRTKFVEDLKESILEMDEMENLRIESELEKQKLARNRASENRDSGVADMELPPVVIVASTENGKVTGDNISQSGGVANGLKRSALSNSLLDIHEQIEKPPRRGSAGSLDSGMSVSFQSSAASLGSRDSSPHQTAQTNGKVSGPGVGSKSQSSGSSSSSSSSLSANQSFLGGLFGKKGKNQSRTSMKIVNTSDATEV